MLMTEPRKLELAVRQFVLMWTLAARHPQRQVGLSTSRTTSKMLLGASEQQQQQNPPLLGFDQHLASSLVAWELEVCLLALEERAVWMAQEQTGQAQIEKSHRPIVTT